MQLKRYREISSINRNYLQTHKTNIAEEALRLCQLKNKFKNIVLIIIVQTRRLDQSD